MKIVSTLLLFAVLATGCQSDLRASREFYFPAEWEPQEVVWVSFFGGPMDEVAFEVVKAVARYTPVKCIVPGSHRDAYAVEARLGSMGVDLNRIEVVRSEEIVQARDVGPIFVRNGDGELRVVDFRWNNYGHPDALHGSFRDTYPFDSLMARALQIPLITSSLVMEGGALETNGKGTLLQVEAVTLQRNPGKTKVEIEEELKRVLGQRKVIWLKEGPAEDPHRMAWIADRHAGQGVGGHVDEFARFVNPTTILLAFPDSTEAANDPVKRITYERMKVNYDLLRQATDQDGEPFEIIKVPVPDAPYVPIVVDASPMPAALRQILNDTPSLRPGDSLYWVPASSYLNFFVTNGLVLVPAYWQPGMPQAVRDKDERFRGIIKQFYPDREIVPIPSLALNMNGGGLHCWTQQQPARMP